MEPEKASTRMKTKKTKMLISFKNKFCSKNRQIKHKSLFWIWKFEFVFWIWNVINQMIVFSAFIQSGYRGTHYHFSISLGFFFSARKLTSTKIILFSVLFMPYNKSFIDQASSVKMARYWPRTLFTSLWTSTLSRSIKTHKENSANIQPSWYHLKIKYRNDLIPVFLQAGARILLQFQILQENRVTKNNQAFRCEICLSVDWNECLYNYTLTCIQMRYEVK